MKRIALTLAAVLLAASPAWALTTTTNPSIPSGNFPRQILSESTSRYSLTALVQGAAGDATCSQTDKSVASGLIVLSTAATTLIPGEMLWCRSNGGGTLTVVAITMPSRSSSERVALNNGSNTLVVPKDSRRIQAQIWTSTADDVFCGYECPATTASNVLLTNIGDTFTFKGKAEICCFTDEAAQSVTAVVDRME